MAQSENRKMRTITLEEHFATPAFMAGPGRDMAERVRAFPQGGPINAHLVEQLLDLDGLRIADMDAAGIDVQVLSLNSPGVEQLDANAAVSLARDTNDYLAEAIKRHPNRLAGFATLSTAAPDLAADELERTVREFGFKGAVINGHAVGRYLDDPFFWPIFERAEALRVPIYLHPTPPPQAVIQASYVGNFSAEVTAQLAASGWGWHIETAVHVLRIILSGVFDRYPHLQLVIGHLGEALPFMLPRLDHNMPNQLTKLQRSMGAYLRENLYYTFSGFNYLPNFLDLLFQVGVDRIMFSADYPYASMLAARNFLEQLPISPADRDRIAHGNAEHLLRM
ncbi:MAG TPA: amidohydrolase family protein [Anaerolineaceae bacterium]|nr:amidohydrolase family protein [Anaerolineaceae bacterium]